ncbi:MAG: F420-0--gamma-glutamyl ligase [Porticoccaceae bacterium]|nr:MAG: F420-0--gamma-glutamyl ligase [Porticoccaceae bacterium]
MTVCLHPLRGLPEVVPGADLAELLACALADEPVAPRPGDALVVAQKAVSKAEGRYRRLAEVTPSPRARELATACQKDPRLVELILAESAEVLRVRPGALIVRHRLGWVQANAGIDQSNIDSSPEDPRVLLLPEDPEASARRLRERLAARTGVELAVVISDSAGRPWRNGILGFALAAAGFAPVVDRVGEPDRFGRPLRITQVAVADALAAAAVLVMGEGAEGVPAVLVRGLALAPPHADWPPMVRDPAEDLFR